MRGRGTNSSVVMSSCGMHDRMIFMKHSHLREEGSNRRSTGVTWIFVVVALAAALVVAGCVGEENNRKLTIIGTTAGAQTNYQMKLTVYNSSGTDTPGTVHLRGNARSDFGDIRFTKSDGVTLLDYCRTYAFALK